MAFFITVVKFQGVSWFLVPTAFEFRLPVPLFWLKAKESRKGDLDVSILAFFVI